MRKLLLILACLATLLPVLSSTAFAQEINWDPNSYLQFLEKYATDPIIYQDPNATVVNKQSSTSKSYSYTNITCASSSSCKVIADEAECRTLPSSKYGLKVCAIPKENEETRVRLDLSVESTDYTFEAQNIDKIQSLSKRAVTQPQVTNPLSLSYGTLYLLMPAKVQLEEKILALEKAYKTKQEADNNKPVGAFPDKPTTLGITYSELYQKLPSYLKTRKGDWYETYLKQKDGNKFLIELNNVNPGPEEVNDIAYAYVNTTITSPILPVPLNFKRVVPYSAPSRGDLYAGWKMAELTTTYNQLKQTKKTLDDKYGFTDLLENTNVTPNSISASTGDYQSYIPAFVSRYEKNIITDNSDKPEAAAEKPNTLGGAISEVLITLLSKLVQIDQKIYNVPSIPQMAATELYAMTNNQWTTTKENIDYEKVSMPAQTNGKSFQLPLGVGSGIYTLTNSISRFTTCTNEDDYTTQDTSVKDYIEGTRNSCISTSSTPIVTGDINCNQNVPEQSVPGLNKSEAQRIADVWMGGDKGHNYFAECNNDVIARAKAGGIDPILALTIWIIESDASNYEAWAARGVDGIEDFGIHVGAYASKNDFSKQLDGFIAFINGRSFTSWTEFAGVFGPYGKPPSNQEELDWAQKYLEKLQTYYNMIAPGQFPPTP